MLDALQVNKLVSGDLNRDEAMDLMNHRTGHDCQTAYPGRLANTMLGEVRLQFGTRASTEIRSHRFQMVQNSEVFVGRLVVQHRNGIFKEPS